jgi:hypothetical protein
MTDLDLVENHEVLSITLD